MDVSTLEDWKSLLESNGIPPTPAAQYASILSNNGISSSNVLDLDKLSLENIGIKLLGHQLKILRLGRPIIKQEEASQSGEHHAEYKRPSASASAKLPTISTDMTLPQFRKFRVDWGVYVTITGIPARERTAHLYSACEPSVQNSIINAKPTFLSMLEEEAITLIEAVVTKRANPAVHRKSFTTITQTDTESIQDFLTRLQTAVPDCEFSCPNCAYDLSDINIKDQFIRGLKNSTIQTEILSKAGQLKTLDEVISHAQSIESAIRDQSQIEKGSGNPDHVYGNRDTPYKRNKQKYRSDNSNSNDSKEFKPYPCKGCGSTQHLNRERDQKCPAWGKICKNCGKENHFASACFRPNSKPDSNPDVQGILFA